MKKCNGANFLPHNSNSLTFWTIFFTENIRYPFKIFPVIGTWGTKYLNSLIINVSFLLANCLEMYKMRCNRQVNKNYFPFLHNFIEITILAFLGFAGRKSRGILMEAKEKYRGVFEIQKSGDKTSSGEIGLDIRTHASPKVGQDQVSGGVSVLCWHAAPVGNERWHKTTLNIHIFLMECTRKLKFGMMICHYLVNSFGYSMMPYDLDRCFQGHWYRV